MTQGKKQLKLVIVYRHDQNRAYWKTPAEATRLASALGDLVQTYDEFDKEYEAMKLLAGPKPIRIVEGG